jgi:ADP-L-glycero-D-manno-heptose 6-epimerase
MASVIYHAFYQIKNTGNLKLFKSHHPNYTDGGQMRDFIYVKDLIEVSYWLMNHLPENGLYNLGSGKAATFNQLANAVFTALQVPINIEYIDTPIDIRDKYQYFTEATMHKLFNAGYEKPFSTIDEGVKDYIENYLIPSKMY